jgi:galactokinase
MLEVTMDNPPVRLLSLFTQVFPQQSPERVLKTPGREMWTASTSAPNDILTIYLTETQARTRFTVRSARYKKTARRRPLPSWARYIAGVAWALDEQNMDIPGMQVAIAGNEPQGPRYDYALGMAFAALVYHLNQKLCTDSALVELVERVRRDYIDSR